MHTGRREGRVREGKEGEEALPDFMMTQIFDPMALSMSSRGRMVEAISGEGERQR